LSARDSVVIRMDDKPLTRTRRFNRSEILVRSVSSEAFGREILNYVSSATPIRNFGSYYFPASSPHQAVLSFWCGTISSYWFRKNASEIISSSHFKSSIRREIRSVPSERVMISLWRPLEGHQLSQVFRRVGILERISVTTKEKGFSSQSFFLRSRKDGPVQPHEFFTLTELLPLAHELIALRHRIVGSEAYEALPDASVSRLRSRGLSVFLQLSPRETDVCDCIVKGLSTRGTALQMGVSENTVRTLRRRSYRKLNITSGYELLAMLAKERADFS